MNILNQSESHPGRYGSGGRLTPIWEIGDARGKIRIKLLKETILSVTQTKLKQATNSQNQFRTVLI